MNCQKNMKKIKIKLARLLKKNLTVSQQTMESCLKTKLKPYYMRENSIRVIQ